MERADSKKWEYRKYSALTGETVAEYSKSESVIEARSHGVICKNVVIDDNDGLQDFAQALSRAWKSHQQLRAQILEALMGKL